MPVGYDRQSKALPLGGVLLYCPILNERPRVQLGEGALTGCARWSVVRRVLQRTNKTSERNEPSS